MQIRAGLQEIRRQGGDEEWTWGVVGPYTELHRGLIDTTETERGVPSSVSRRGAFKSTST